MAFILRALAHPVTFLLQPGTTVTLGRGDTVECRVPDAAVSRQHAKLVVRETHVEVEDLQSTAGTWTSGMRRTRHALYVGQVISFGTVSFRLERAPDADEPPDDDLSDDRTTTGGAPAAVAPASVTVDAVVSEESRRLGHLLDVAIALTREGSTGILLPKILEGSFALFNADRCTILLMNAEGELIPAISRDKRGAEAPASVPRSIASRVVAERTAIRADDAGVDDRFGGGMSIVMQQVRSVMVAPLLASDGRVLGLLYVDNFFRTHSFTEADLFLLRAFAGIAAAAIENGHLAENVRRQAVARSNLERFFTPKLAAHIADSPEASRLGGDRRQVVVLFSDIRGFTTMSEHLAPDALAAWLSEYFTEMVECVFRHGGTLDKFIGDAIMAQWGAPLRGDDDADRAMLAALDMRTALERLNTRWTAVGRPNAKIGIGISCGEAFAGNIGSERRLEFTVIGDTVNVASRLCSVAGPGDILVSDAFRLALHAPPAMSALPPMMLKGKNAAVDVFRVDG
jgi:adenylate cyclase